MVNYNYRILSETTLKSAVPLYHQNTLHMLVYDYDYFTMLEEEVARYTESHHIVLGPDQNLVPIGVTKLYCDFQLDKYMRALKMYDGLFRTVA